MVTFNHPAFNEIVSLLKKLSKVFEDSPHIIQQYKDRMKRSYEKLISSLYLTDSEWKLVLEAMSLYCKDKIESADVEILKYVNELGYKVSDMKKAREVFKEAKEKHQLLKERTEIQEKLEEKKRELEEKQKEYEEYKRKQLEPEEQYKQSQKEYEKVLKELNKYNLDSRESTTNVSVTAREEVNE